MKKQISTKKALLCSILALCLCCTMLVGTTFAWFTDSVSSDNNIIQSGSLDVEMYWAEGSEEVDSANWTDASEGPMFTSTLWEPGYTEARHIKIANVGTLALNYKLRIVANGVVSKLADVIDVYYVNGATKIERSGVEGLTKLGTLTEILGTAKNLSNTVKGDLFANETDTLTLVLKMQESAGNEYQNLSIGTDFSVELIATQMASENDTFGSDYDANTSVTNPSVPAALVRAYDKLNINCRLGLNGSSDQSDLDAGYQFEPTASWEEAKQSDYRYWHADFAVYADGTVPANSLMLAGYYKEWCQYIDDEWVGLTADMDIPANTEVRLVEALGATVNWEELCKYGNDGLGFLCGVSDLTGANAGTTLTVELRIYETPAQGECSNGGGCTHPDASCETGADNYITVGKFTYTFPAFEVEGQGELTAALENGAKDIAVSAGTYTFPADKLTAGTTLYCEEGTVFTGTSGANIAGATVVGATFKNDAGYAVTGTVNATFKNCTFESSEALRWCYSAAGTTTVFEDCVINTDFRGAHFDALDGNVIFKNCEIAGFNAFGGEGTLTFEGCKMGYSDSNYNGLNLYMNVTLIDCDFTFVSSKTNFIDMEGVGKTLTITNCTATLDGATTSVVNFVGGSKLAQNTVIVDGVQQ